MFSQGVMQGGHKMIVRHVETLRSLGFDAVCYLRTGSTQPTWFAHNAPIILADSVGREDIVVMPDDVPNALKSCADQNLRTVILLQNLYYCASKAMPSIDLFSKDRFPPVISVGSKIASDWERLYPHGQIELVRCFADERRFAPGNPKKRMVAYTPRKRPVEAAATMNLLQRLHARHADVPWFAIQNMSEAQAAEIFTSASLCLSLNRLESVGMTTLEAMASGCVCAGFTGIGGEEYATAENGFWVPNEDCVAAADALAEAADLVNTGGPALKARLEAGYETAKVWSYAAFKDALEQTWMRLAPEARVSSRPLDG
jgi:glycosyltransferase involved in cell wall biosynthesis